MYEFRKLKKVQRDLKWLLMIDYINAFSREVEENISEEIDVIRTQ